ncbi:ABC transporter ATP-binding protein [Mesorhizobium sp. KR1-2]|uniref:ABC transporter ATP-binding protein n=1 Tax=Mesorhizobium sp. KR1-2 TaxID=3156609 RepID=UPI0032B3B7AD
MQDAVLKLDTVCKTFGSVVAADDIELSVGQTEFFALLGPSGSGKTTMLRMIAGLERPTSGRILIGDRDITDLPPYARGIGMVFQDFLLFPHKTVAENIVFPLKMRNASTEEKRKNLDWVSGLVRLKGLEERYPHQLSGGQKQRVALARGLVSRPELLLLDEPLANLDRELRKEMEIEIRRFQIELGIPFVYVTHNQEEALTMADRMAVMRDGRMEQIGGKFDLYHDPKTRFVASFLGSPNAIEGKVTSLNGAFARLDWHGFSFEARAHPSLAVGDSAVCFVKSEKIEINPKEGAIAGTLRDAIFKGQYVDHLVRLRDGRELTVSGPPVPMAPGSDVFLSWPAAAGDAFPLKG